MDKETLSNYGWIVICVLVLAVMLALATPFGSFIADGFKATYTGLFETGDSALDVGLSAVGVKNVLDCGHERSETGDHTQKECGHYNCQDADCGCVPALCGVEGHWSGDGLDHTTVVNHTGHTYACQCMEGWVVPEGGTYYVGVTSNKTGDYTGAKTIYNAGETLPDCYVAQSKDVYTYGDYEYRYNYYCYFSTWTLDKNQKGWSPRVFDQTKETYGEILTSINNSPVTAVNGTFYNCTNLLESPEIPEGIMIMHYTFRNCSKLKTAPTIPSTVTGLGFAFDSCYNLTTAPDISYCQNLTSIQGTFLGCTSLKTYAGSADPDGDFSNYVIPNNVTWVLRGFENCKKLTHAPNIPDGVTQMGSTFSGCTSLLSAPTIPASVVCMYNTFYKCTALSGTVEINTNLITNTNGSGGDGDCKGCFYNVDMSKITITGSASKDVLNLIGSTGYNWTPIE